jgi:hypothetical protein
MFWLAVIVVLFILKPALDGVIPVDTAGLFLLIAAAAIAVGLRRFLRAAVAVAAFFLFLIHYGGTQPIEGGVAIIALAVAVYGIALIIRSVVSPPK